MYNQQSNHMQLLSRFLKKLNYTYVQQSLDDAGKVIDRVRTLKPEIMNLPSDNNKLTEQQVCLTGTIPIRFREKRYNIPIKIYLSKLHPVQSPTCYVCPTPGMIVKPNHRNVGQRDGRVYVQYLSTWNYETSSLFDLVQNLCGIFGGDPPVFKDPNYLQNKGRIQNRRTPSYTANTNYDMDSVGVTHGRTESNPQYIQGGSFYGTTGGYGLTHGRTPSSLPTPQYSQGGVYGLTHGRTPSPQYSQGGSFYGGNTGGYTPIRPVRKPGISKEEKLAVKKNELKARVITKLKTITEEKNKEYAKNNQELIQAKLISNDLENNVKIMENQILQFDQHTETFKNTISSANKYLENNTGEVDVDKIINIQDTLQRQKLNSEAESEVFSDLMYYLDKCAIRGNITLDKWLNYTLHCSRNQFMKKALIQKIEQRKRF